MPVVIYSALRLAMMGAVFVISLLLGAGVLIAAILAIIVGWSLSFLLLKPYADAATAWFAQRRVAQKEGRAPRFTAQIAADEAEEDALIESAQGGEQHSEPGPSERPEMRGLQREGDSQTDSDSELD